MKLRYYSASWCKVCKAMQPMVEAVCKSEGVPFEFVDVETLGFTEDTKSITSLPTIEIRNEKGHVKDCRAGKISQHDLLKWIRGYK